MFHFKMFTFMSLHNLYPHKIELIAPAGASVYNIII
jgi:hypothetical protein